jgi:hypothetical protein
VAANADLGDARMEQALAVMGIAKRGVSYRQRQHRRSYQLRPTGKININYNGET